MHLRRAWIQWCSLIWKGCPTEDFPEMDQGWLHWLRHTGLAQWQQLLLTPSSHIGNTVKKTLESPVLPPPPHITGEGLATLYVTPPKNGTAALNEAVLLIPPCSHRASIFDIQPNKSIINELTTLGYHVIVLEWHTPPPPLPDDQNTEKKTPPPIWSEYRTTLLETFQKISTEYDGIHVIGLCLGGVMALDALTAHEQHITANTGVSIRSLTLLATLLDYRTPGPLSCMQWPPLYAALRQQLSRLSWIPATSIYSVCCALLPSLPPSPSPLSQWSQHGGLNVSAPLAQELLEAFYIHNFLIEPDPLTGTSPLSRLKIPLYAVGGLSDRLVPIQGLINGLHVCSADLPVRLSLFEAGHLRCFLPGQTLKGYQAAWKGESLERWLHQAEITHPKGWIYDWSQWTQALTL